MEPVGEALAPVLLVSLLDGQLGLAEHACAADPDCLLQICEAKSQSFESSSFVCSTCMGQQCKTMIFRSANHVHLVLQNRVQGVPKLDRHMACSSSGASLQVKVFGNILQKLLMQALHYSEVYAPPGSRCLLHRCQASGCLIELHRVSFASCMLCHAMRITSHIGWLGMQTANRVHLRLLATLGCPDRPSNRVHSLCTGVGTLPHNRTS